MRIQLHSVAMDLSATSCGRGNAEEIRTSTRLITSTDISHTNCLLDAEEPLEDHCRGSSMNLLADGPWPDCPDGTRDSPTSPTPKRSLRDMLTLRQEF